ncbi:hypothetical protein [Paenibacillus sp. FSL K6-0108]|uniref:hypothetical protein n=1 Tax=Paenibacillus sp. FSL K6-0108 TaxID=2921417 RepID=UPI0032453B91
MRWRVICVCCRQQGGQWEIQNHGEKGNTHGVQVDVHIGMECEMNKHRKREVNALFRSPKSNIYPNLMEVDEDDNEQQQTHD